MFSVGQIITGTTKDTADIFGRILEIFFWPHEDGNHIAMIIIEESPTVGYWIQHIQGNDLTNIRVIEGTGFPASKWQKENGKWIRRKV